MSAKQDRWAWDHHFGRIAGDFGSGLAVLEKVWFSSADGRPSFAVVTLPGRL
jgi:hypothetical protein